MKNLDYMTWENLCSTIIVQGEQRVHKVSASPRIDLFWDGARMRMGLWLETAANTVVPAELLKLSFISLGVVVAGSRNVLEIAIDSKSLRRQFYHFAVAVSEQMISGSRSAVEAVTSELQCFADLLTERLLLSVERQIGLLGELLFLEELMQNYGVRLFDSWIGPQSEPHDFRVDNLEFEVKTTVSTQRVHIIHGSEQLVPSSGCTLHLLSILLGPPGSGVGSSLASSINNLKRILAGDRIRFDRFVKALEMSGCYEADLVYYERQFSLRRPIGVIAVDDSFPALTRPFIQQSLGALAQRIESIQYSVNVEGLEKDQGTQQFSTVFARQ